MVATAVLAAAVVTVTAVMVDAEGTVPPAEGATVVRGGTVRRAKGAMGVMAETALQAGAKVDKVEVALRA